MILPLSFALSPCHRFHFHIILNELNLLDNTNHVYCQKSIFLQEIVKCLLRVYTEERTQSVNKDTGARGIGKNKLRTYRLLKREFGTEFYLR